MTRTYIHIYPQKEIQIITGIIIIECFKRRLRKITAFTLEDLVNQYDLQEIKQGHWNK